MREITTKDERAKKTRNNQLIIGIVLMSLMILSTIGFAFINNTSSQSLDKIEYNGIEFINNGNLWYFNIQNIEFSARYNPEELKDINFAGYNSIQNYNNKPLYFVGELGEHFFEIDRNLRDRFVLRINQACFGGLECEEDFPVKDCSDNLIIFKIPNNESEKIYKEENCVFIVANYSNQVKYADAFLFDILDI